MRKTVLACVFVSACCAAYGQTTPEFEVATVKQLDRSLAPGTRDLSFVGTSGKLAKIAGNRVTLTGTLHTIIATAYDVKDYQVTGAPSWADSLMYTITGETPGAIRARARVTGRELSRVPACFLSAARRPDLKIAVSEKRRRLAAGINAPERKESR